MSVDRTIEELSGTLSQLSQLVGHINAQIGGITSRINQTLDNFDKAVTGVANDATAVTGQVGSTVSNIPDAWVFYLLFITVIVVFILLSIVLLLNLITKAHAIYAIIKGRMTPDDRRALVSSSRDDDSSGGSSGAFKTHPSSLLAPSLSTTRHVAIPMESEPRRPGILQPRRNISTIEDDSQLYHRRYDDASKYSTDQSAAYSRRGADV